MPTKLSLASFGLVAAVLALAPIESVAATITFEGLTDGTSVGQTFSSNGILFSNAAVLTSGLSLDESEFPPHSGQNVATDDGGPVGVTFTSAVSVFSGYFTYAEPVEIVAFDVHNNQVASISSLYGSNYTSSGEAPNELLTLTYASGIKSLTITGDPGGGSFVMDDLSFTTSTGTPIPPSLVPELGCFWLLSTGLITILGLRFSRVAQA